MAALPNTTGGLAALLGIELLEAGPDRVVATMPVTPDHHQPMGYLHGGASVACAETLVSYGAFLGAPVGHTACGREINANHIRSTLDGLLTQLSRTSDRRRAKRVEERIWEYWRESDSKSVDLLVGWARSAMRDKRFGQALDLLDQVVVLRPNYSEGWNQRATLHYMMSDFIKSIADIERTLALQPRHFGALSGLAAILERTGQKKRALDVWYRTLKVYPAMKSGQDAIVRLEEELAGS